ncbi:MAG: hypothetical protein IJ298_11220 [Ruminococcus sp.]|nr:hypothetical protein [Ruminococcus sp.]
MKFFKNLFLVLLSIVFVLSAVVPCFAEDVSLEDELEVAFADYCTGKVPMHIDDVKEVSIGDVYILDDVVVFSADSWKWKDHGRVSKTLLKWDISAYNHHFPYDLGVYVYNNGKIITLEEAIEEELITDLDFLNDFDGISCINQDLTQQCAEAFLKYNNKSTSDEVCVECTPLGTVNGYVFFRGDVYRADSMFPAIVVDDMIGDYIYRAGRPYGTEENPTGLYALKNDGTVCQAFELYEAGVLTDKQIAQAAGGAYSTELDKYGEWDYEDIIIPALEEKYPYIKDRYSNYSECYVHYTVDEKTGEEIPVYALIFQYPYYSEYVQSAHIINDMVLEGYSGLPFTYGYGVYIFETGEFYDLLEVPDLNLDGKANLYKSVNYRYRMGDNNGDYNLTIQDATYMQKCLAGLEDFREDDNITEYFDNPEKEVYISDYNQDGVRNIKDATDIQKRIAGITVE